MPVSLLQAIYVPADDLTDPAPATTFAHLDATTVLSRSIAELGIYPAVDPLDSTSRMLDVRIIGEEHYNVARGVQRVLQVRLQFTHSSPAREISAGQCQEWSCVGAAAGCARGMDGCVMACTSIAVSLDAHVLIEMSTQNLVRLLSTLLGQAGAMELGCRFSCSAIRGGLTAA